MLFLLRSTKHPTEFTNARFTVDSESITDGKPIIAHDTEQEIFA